jgi:hypothetical protein
MPSEEIQGRLDSRFRRWPRLVLTWLLVALSQAALSATAQSEPRSVQGVTFSDRLGGFILERATGTGSMDDPFVLFERMTDTNGGTLAFTVPVGFGNRIGSQHVIGFALIKVIENATDQPWSSFELELQSKLGVPSDDSDGLSFGQGSTAGRPFTAAGFADVIVQDTPYDRIELDQGKILPGGRIALHFVITESNPLGEAYLLQRPTKPVSLKTTPHVQERLALR